MKSIRNFLAITLVAISTVTVDAKISLTPRIKAVLKSAGFGAAVGAVSGISGFGTVCTLVALTANNTQRQASSQNLSLLRESVIIATSFILVPALVGAALSGTISAITYKEKTIEAPTSITTVEITPTVEITVAEPILAENNTLEIAAEPSTQAAPVVEIPAQQAA